MRLHPVETRKEKYPQADVVSPVVFLFEPMCDRATDSMAQLKRSLGNSQVE